MKTILLFVLSFTLSTAVIGQAETLFSDANSYGGFGGPFIEFSNINGTLVGDVGGGGALIINNLFIGGYGLGNDAASVTLENDEIYDIDFGHGGLWFGYTYNQHKLIHLYTSFRVGWGEVELLQNDDKAFDDNFLALAPEAGVELNITSWFKLGLSGGYRYVSGVEDLPVLTNADFTGMFGALTFRFGGFGDYDYKDNDDKDIDFDF